MVRRGLISNAEIAQTAEHNHGKVGVRGSIPRLGSKRRNFMMKRIILALVLLSPSASFSAETPVANIKVSADWGKAQCASEPGKGITLDLKSVEDKRAVKAVGTLKKRGDEEVEVLLSTPINDLVKDAVAAVFKNCGFEVKTDGTSGIATTIRVDKLFAGSKKGFFTGETDANGSLILHFANSGKTYDFNLSASKSDKKLKKKNVRQLEEVLTGLLESVVSQIGESPALITELKNLSR